MTGFTRKKRKMKQPVRLLLMGYLPPPHGGVRVLFKQLVRALETFPAIRATVIQMTGRRRGRMARSAGLFHAGFRFLLRLHGSDVVSLHPTNAALVILGPWVCMMAKLFGKPVIVRKFGGGFQGIYAGWPWWVRTIVRRTVFRSDLCLFETRSQCRFFSSLCRRVEWFPNSRPIPARRAPLPSGPPRRFVYIGHMRRIKGVESIYRMAARLPAGFSCHLYGALGFDVSKEQVARWESESPARYLGELTPEGVMDTLGQYHCLLLPSSPGEGKVIEGHPGVILESFSRGVPVIASDSGGIGEIVDDTCGVLVEPGNGPALARAVLELAGDPEWYERLSRGAMERSAAFDSRYWNRVFTGFCMELYRG